MSCQGIFLQRKKWKNEKMRWNQYWKTRMMADVCLFRFNNPPTNIAPNNKSGTVHTRQKSRNLVFTYENRPCQSMSWSAVARPSPISTYCHRSPTIATKHRRFTQWLRPVFSPLLWWPGQRPWPGRRRSWPRGWLPSQQTEMFSVLRKDVERPWAVVSPLYLQQLQQAPSSPRTQ